MVKGKVTITNPAPVAATINSVTDTILGFGEIPVTCGDITTMAFQAYLPAQITQSLRTLQILIMEETLRQKTALK